MQKIEILGSGCSRCAQTERVVRSVIEQEHLDVQVVKEESFQRIAALNVLSTPAIAIDGKVLLAGRIPTVEEVRTMLGVG